MIRRPPRSTHCISSAASDVYKRQAIVSTMTVPEFFLYLCGCVALVHQGRGPRRSVHLSSRRSTLPRKLHMNPAGLTYDPAPHRANHLLSRRFNLPQKLHYVAFISAGAVPNAAPCGPVNLLDRRSSSSRRCAYRVRRLLTMQPPVRPTVYSTVALIRRESCIYIPVSYTHLTLPTICSV